MRLLATVALLSLAACAHGPSSKERKTAEIHHDLAVEALRKGMAQDAMREYDLALEADSTMAEAHRGRGLVLEFAFGKHQQAEAEYRRALALKPTYSEAHNDLGHLLARTGRYEEALKEFDTALDSTFYTEPWVARLNKGMALHQMGRREAGLAEIRNCLAISPRYCAARRELGILLLGEGRTGEAIESLSAYARDCEAQPDAHLQLGLARMKAGDLPGARASFQRCLELARGAPSGDDCRRSLARLE
jgi:type IV pilus assembly protein PilF